MIRRPPRSTLSSSSAASDVYKRQHADPTATVRVSAHVLRQHAAGVADAIDDNPAVTVRPTEPETISNLRIVLELCASGTLRCSQKTRRPNAASVYGLSLLLAAGEFYTHEPIAAYAWPLLVQAGSLAELAGNHLQLTARGRTALSAPPSATIRGL